MTYLYFALQQLRLIFICSLAAEKTKEKAYLYSHSKSILLQLEMIMRKNKEDMNACMY